MNEEYMIVKILIIIIPVLYFLVRMYEIKRENKRLDKEIEELKKKI